MSDIAIVLSIVLLCAACYLVGWWHGALRGVDAANSSMRRILGVPQDDVTAFSQFAFPRPNWLRRLFRRRRAPGHAPQMSANPRVWRGADGLRWMASQRNEILDEHPVEGGRQMIVELIGGPFDGEVRDVGPQLFISILTPHRRPSGDAGSDDIVDLRIGNYAQSASNPKEFQWRGYR